MGASQVKKVMPKLKRYKRYPVESERGKRKKNFFGMDHPTFITEHFYAPMSFSTLFTKQAEFKAGVQFPLYAPNVRNLVRKIPRVRAFNLFSHIMNRYITVDVSMEGVDVIDNAGGIDNYLLKNDASEFRSYMATRLKDFLLNEIKEGNDWRDKEIETDPETGLKVIQPTVHWADLVGFDKRMTVHKKRPKEPYRCLQLFDHKVEI